MEKNEVVGDWMTPAPHVLAPTDTIDHAYELLREHGFRHLPIVREGVVVGLVSERDLYVASKFADTRGMKVGTLVEEAPYAVTSQTSLFEVASTMATKRHGAALVVDEGRLLGVFTTVDALRALAGRKRDGPRRPVRRHGRKFIEPRAKGFGSS
jgi:CBS domain-containing protein